MASKAEVVKSQEQDLAEMEMPAWLKERKGQPIRGQEEMEAKHMTMPRVAIAQDGTAQVKEANALHIEGLRPGMMFNTLTRRVYGKEVFFTPLFFYTSRIMFKDLDDGGGVLCLNPTGKKCPLNHDGPCQYANWGANGEKPACTEFMNFPSLVYPGKDPAATPHLAVVSFKSTGNAAAKELNALIRFRGRDTFAGVYRMWTVPAKQANNDYWEPRVENAGWVTPELFKFAESQYEILHAQHKSKGLDVDVEGNDGDTSFNPNELENSEV
jgi:hypothetical protein